VFNVNTLAPMRVAETFARHLERAQSPRLLNISSKLGSIQANETSGAHLYRSSKAALNMVTKCLSIDLDERGVIVAAVHPGHVSTDMGGRNAALSPEDSAAGVLAMAQRLSPADNGGFYGYDGTALPW
jgi:NAD(P)-dependent dehydrogenase (short-subunit alcohol dehydrogenase family)